MTAEERWKIEGRTREALREAKRNVASLKIEIEQYAQRLQDAAGSLRHLLGNPVGPGPTGMTASQYTIHFFQNLISEDVAQKLNEYEAESARLADLETKVKGFD